MFSDSVGAAVGIGVGVGVLTGAIGGSGGVGGNNNQLAANRMMTIAAAATATDRATDTIRQIRRWRWTRWSMPCEISRTCCLVKLARGSMGSVWARIV